MMSRADQTWPKEMTYALSVPATSNSNCGVPDLDSHRTVTYKGWPQLHLAIENLIGAVIAAEVKSNGEVL
jgi:hypothetical protein